MAESLLKKIKESKLKFVITDEKSNFMGIFNTYTEARKNLYIDPDSSYPEEIVAYNIVGEQHLDSSYYSRQKKFLSNMKQANTFGEKRKFAEQHTTGNIFVVRYHSIDLNNELYAELFDVLMFFFDKRDAKEYVTLVRNYSMSSDQLSEEEAYDDYFIQLIEVKVNKRYEGLFNNA